MKKLLALLLVASCFTAKTQTGPAGIGSTTNNCFWLKADAGTTSTVNNTPISGWNDQSGNSAHMTQTTSTQQPSFATNVINGFPAVQFDNITNTNDKMLGPDLPILDNTNGYSFFTVTRPQNVDGAARVVVSKRTTVSVDQSFMLFYYTGNKFTVDIQTTDDRFGSSASFSANNDYLVDIIYNGTLPTASRVAVYLGETFDRWAPETATLVPDNASPIILGTTDASDPRPYGGYIAEVIIYREALGPAQRIIVNNYLSAKYNIALSANDKYAGDNAGNGNYDNEVAGVGSESAGSSTSFSPSVSGGLGISVTAGLDAGDYVLAGHAVLSNSVNFTDVGGMTGTYNGRWDRIWYVDVTNTLTAMTGNLVFDMSDGGVGTVAVATASNYVLLYRAGQSGSWTQTATATSVSGDRVLFNGVSLSTDGYYTIGSLNIAASPLPVELYTFKASQKDAKIVLDWSTLSEKNSKSFTVQRSGDGLHFTDLGTVDAKGDSQTQQFYTFTDNAPPQGIVYYRLQQNDRDGSFRLSALVSVYPDRVGTVRFYPNPVDGTLHLMNEQGWKVPVTVEICDAAGRVLISENFVAESGQKEILMDTQKILSAGNYILRVTAAGQSSTQQLFIR